MDSIRCDPRFVAIIQRLKTTDPYAAKVCADKTSEMNPTNFFTELKRRNVHKLAVAYAVVSWLLIQTVSSCPYFDATYGNE